MSGYYRVRTANNFKNTGIFSSFDVIFYRNAQNKQIRGISSEINKQRGEALLTMTPEEMFECHVAWLLTDLVTNFENILLGDLTWVEDYRQFWKSVKKLEAKILSLDNDHPLKKEFLDPLSPPLSWLLAARHYFNET